MLLFVQQVDKWGWWVMRAMIISSSVFFWWSRSSSFHWMATAATDCNANEHNFSSVLKSSSIFWFLSCWLFGNGAQKQPNAATPGSCVADLTDGTMMDDLDNNMWAARRQLIVYLLLLKMESLAAVGVHQVESFPFLKLHSSDTDLKNMTEASSEFSLLTASFWPRCTAALSIQLEYIFSRLF